MSVDITVIKAPQKVVITESRWEVYVNVTEADGTKQEYVASADAHWTEHDAIWFGTRQEFEEQR